MTLPAISIHAENLQLRTKVQLLETQLKRERHASDTLLSTIKELAEAYKAFGKAQFWLNHCARRFVRMREE